MNKTLKKRKFKYPNGSSSVSMTVFFFSYFNEMEIQTIIKYVETLVNLSKEDNVKVDQTQIGIVTPYVRQVSFLNQV